MQFQASLLSEGSEGYGDARSRALYSQVMLQTFGQRYPGNDGISYGAEEAAAEGSKKGLSSEQITELTKTGTQLATGLVGLFTSGSRKKKEEKAAAEAAALASRQSAEAARLAESQAKVEAQKARAAEAEAAVRTKQIMVFGGLGLAAIAAGVTVFVLVRKK